MKALCVLFNLKPDPKQSTKFDNEGVFSVMKRKFQNAKKLIKEMEEVEKLSLTQEQLEQLQKITKKSDFGVNNTEHTLKTLSVIAKWVLLLVEKNKF